MSEQVRKTFTEDERIVVLKTLANDINAAGLADITAEEVDYVIKKGKYKGKKSIITWVSLGEQRILGYKFSASGFLNLSFVLEGTSEETLKEVGQVAAALMKLNEPIMPDDFTTFETEFNKPEKKTGPRINVAELQAKLAAR